MEIRQISGIFIDIYHDSILGLSYGKILTESTLESIRFPTLLDNYKYKYLIEPNQLLQLEVLKTKKNWILRSINHSQVVYQPKDYQDFVVLSDLPYVQSAISWAYDYHPAFELMINVESLALILFVIIYIFIKRL